MKMHAGFLLAAALAVLTAPIVAEQHVLVVGKAPSSLWHQPRATVASRAAATSVSAAGLAELAMATLGLPTGQLSTRDAAVALPLQADVFSPASAYAVVLVDDDASSVVDTVGATLDSTNLFHETFPLTASNNGAKVPVAVAQELRAMYGDNEAAVSCAGSVALCASVGASTTPATAMRVQEVLTGNRFLDESMAEDVAFATELAQVAQLTASLNGIVADKTLLVVALSGVAALDEPSKRMLAQEAMALTVTEFLAVLTKTHSSVGAHVTSARLPSAVQEVAALGRRSRQRRMMALLEESDNDSGSDEDEDGDEAEDEEDESASGSAAGNATTGKSATSPMAVPDIAEYQILLWTSVLLGVVLLLAIMALCNMDSGRDSLLYAKFIADVNNRKMD